MIAEPLFTIDSSNPFFGPMNGEGRWAEYPIGNPVAVVWTNDANVLGITRVDWRPERMPEFNELLDKQEDAIANDMHTTEFFNSLFDESVKIFSGELSLGALQLIRSLTIYSDTDVKYFTDGKQFIRLDTDGLSVFLPENKKWAPAPDDEDFGPLTEVSYDTIIENF